jgi:cysteine-rich repeat protein
MCSGEPSSCGEVCGDGIITLTEGCDDSGTTPGDGCDASCQVEPGWICTGEPSVCTPVSVGALDTPARVLLALGLMGLGGFWLAARGVPGRRAV